MPTSSLAEWRKKAQLHVEALDHAVANIPPEQLRMHLCWGNYEGPHHCDVPLADVIDIVFRARPSAIAIEAANPRHAHEWKLFETLKLPDGKMLIPGVIESKSNFIEHPELVAQRIGRYAQAGRPGKRDRRKRLRLRYVGRAGRGRSRRRMGEDGRDGRGRAHRLTGVLEALKTARVVGGQQPLNARASARSLRIPMRNKKRLAGASRLSTKRGAI